MKTIYKHKQEWTLKNIYVITAEILVISFTIAENQLPVLESYVIDIMNHTRILLYNNRPTKNHSQIE